MSEDNIIYNKELRLPQLLIKLQTTYTINTHETIKIAIEIIHHNSKRCTFFTVAVLICGTITLPKGIAQNARVL